jgi:hypothetical protein
MAGAADQSLIPESQTAYLNRPAEWNSFSGSEPVPPKFESIS